MQRSERFNRSPAARVPDFERLFESYIRGEKEDGKIGTDKNGSYSAHVARDSDNAVAHIVSEAGGHVRI